jgi:shikimate dehydrogenase
LTLVGVLGFPVAHSRSPAMMGAAFEALGLDWRYVRLPVLPERFEETARALPGSGYRGANVTIPHKMTALALADRATEAAAAIGAANTLTFDDGRVEADNTDAGGIADALGEDIRSAHALVLGAGGAARAAAFALREGGAAEVSVWNRTPERAASLAADLGVRFAERPGPADLVVNATSVGLEPAAEESEALEALGLAGLDPPEVLVDLPYGDAETPLCGWASRAGARVIDGVEVLVRQGARSLERWTGTPPPIEAMTRAAREARTG